MDTRRIISASEAKHLACEGGTVEYDEAGRPFVLVEALSYATEVHTVSCQPGSWTGNLLRWPLTEAGKAAAETYVSDLMFRWLAVTETRVVESADAPTEEVAA